MHLTLRSLLLALLACFSMGLFAKSLVLPEGRQWITSVFMATTFALAIGGVWLGLRGARRQRTFRAWLAPALNVFLILAFLILLLLFEQGLQRVG